MSNRVSAGSGNILVFPQLCHANSSWKHVIMEVYYPAAAETLQHEILSVLSIILSFFPVSRCEFDFGLTLSDLRELSFQAPFLNFRFTGIFLKPIICLCFHWNQTEM